MAKVHYQLTLEASPFNGPYDPTFEGCSEEYAIQSGKVALGMVKVVVMRVTEEGEGADTSFTFQPVARFSVAESTEERTGK